MNIPVKLKAQLREIDKYRACYVGLSPTNFKLVSDNVIRMTERIAANLFKWFGIVPGSIICYVHWPKLVIRYEHGSFNVLKMPNEDYCQITVENTGVLLETFTHEVGRTYTACGKLHEGEYLLDRLVAEFRKMEVNCGDLVDDEDKVA